MVYPRLRLGSLLEDVLSGTGGDQLHVMVADVIKSFDTVDRSILVSYSPGMPFEYDFYCCSLCPLVSSS